MTGQQILATSPTQVVVDSIKRISEGRLAKLVMNFLLRKDKSGHTYLELLLSRYSGEDIKLPFSARVIYPFFRRYLDNIIRTFDVDKEDVVESLSEPYARRIMASLLKGFKYFGVRVPFTSGAPLLVVWDFTYRCNLKCKHCYASAGIQLPEMTKEERIKALKILIDAGVAMLALSGGEPLLGPGFWDVLRIASDHGLYLAMATNATLISDDIAEKLAKNGLRFAQVSLDSPYPEFHDMFRGIPGTWERAVRGIKNLKKYGIKVEVSMVITKRNIDQLERMIKFVRDELKADMFMAYNFIPVGRARDILDWDLAPEERWRALKIIASALYEGFNAASTAPQYAVVAYEYAFEAHEKPKIAGHFYTLDWLSDRFGSMLEFLGGCGAGRVYMALEPNGDIYPCVFLRKRIGNILEDDFEELWRTNEFLETLRNRDLLKGACGSCEYKYICGGCRARAYNYYGDPCATDPGCKYAKEEWTKLLKALRSTNRMIVQSASVNLEDKKSAQT